MTAHGRAHGRFLRGVGLSLCGGTLGAAQYAIVTLGKRVAKARAGCEAAACPAWLEEQFDALGSWSVSFGLGALAVSAALHAAQRLAARRAERPPPPLHLRLMRGPGSVAGLLWAGGNVAGTLAVQRGGNAVVVAQMQSIQLITSGAWGVLYYREQTGKRALIWTAAAFWTLGAIVLLGREKV